MESNKENNKTGENNSINKNDENLTEKEKDNIINKTNVNYDNKNENEKLEQNLHESDNNDEVNDNKLSNTNNNELKKPINSDNQENEKEGNNDDEKKIPETKKNDNQQPQVVIMPNPHVRPNTPWTEHKAPSGEFYYYNHITKQSTWKKPDNFIPFRPPFIPHYHQKHIVQKPLTKTEQKPIEKALSMKRIPGTPWHIILTSRNNEFFYNYETKNAIWEIPEEVKDIINDLLEEAKKIKEEREAALKKKEELKKNDEEMNILKEENQETTMKIENEDERKEEKEKLQQKEKEKKVLPDNKSKDNNQQKSNESSKEKKINDFFALLEENDISPFSTWEKELSNIINDKRYTLIPTLKERKRLFDEYCRKKVIEMKKNNELVVEDPIKKYKKLLKEVVKVDTTWKMFMIRNKRDPRYQNLGAKERESIFHEYKKEFEKSERQRREEKKEKNKASFIELLKETKEINAESSWRTIKHIINNDERYDLLSSSEREDCFYDYRKLLRKENEKQKEEKLLERKRREEISLREREREVNKEKYYREKEVKNNRLKTEMNYARIQFQSLLIDYIRNHNITWEKKKSSLMSDYRWQQSRILTETEMKSLFEEHLKTLFEKRLKSFNELLEEVLNKNPIIEWLELYPLIEDDPRVVKLQKSEEELESLFNSYKTKFNKDVEINFKKLLEENSFIEYQIKQEVINSINENEADNKYTITIEEIEEIIKADHRYTLMSTQKEKCKEIIQNHINQLVAKFVTDKHGTSDHSLAKLAGAKIDENKLNGKNSKNEANLKKMMDQKNNNNINIVKKDNSRMDLDKSQPEDLSKLNYDDTEEGEINSKQNKQRSRSRSKNKRENRSRSRSRSRSRRRSRSRSRSRSESESRSRSRSRSRYRSSKSRHRSHHHSKRRRY